jgi:hypothetical protein
LAEDGRFYNRQEAGQDHAASSEELLKMQTAPTFPKLGVGDNRRETPILTSKPQVDLKNKLLTNQQLQSKKFSDPDKQAKFKARLEQLSPGKSVGAASAQPGSGLSYATGNNLRAKTERGQDPNAPMATQLHEGNHLLFNRISQKHGPKAAMNLAHNLYNALPKEARSHLQHYVASKYGGREINPAKYHEEHLSHLLNYLNTPSERKVYHETAGHTPEQQLEISSKLKLAHRALQAASAKADKKWVSKVFKKVEVEQMQKSLDLEWKPTFEQLELAQDMVTIFNEQMPEFKAAGFLTRRL